MLLVPEMHLLFGVIYVELYLRANRIIWQQCLGQEIACTLPNSVKSNRKFRDRAEWAFQSGPHFAGIKDLLGF